MKVETGIGMHCDTCDNPFPATERRRELRKTQILLFYATPWFYLAQKFMNAETNSILVLHLSPFHLSCISSLGFYYSLSVLKPAF
jgi:hypothetical protein